MTANPWEDFARRGRELYEQQAEVARTWLDGQSKLASTLGATPGQEDGPGADAAAMAELWRSWLTLGGSLGGMLSGAGGPGRVAGDTLGRFLDPVSLALVGGSQVGEAIRKLTEGPRLADLGAIERRMGKVMELWLGVQSAARGHEAVVAGAWADANQRFATEYQSRQQAGTAPTQPQEALKLWLEVANQTLLETHRSERFLAAQSQLLRQGMDFLLAEREMVEALVEPAGIPTRTEIDEVHRSLHELKRRVRILERAAATPAVPPARPVKRPAARKRASGGQA
jgi:polyhydroxyalkanoate synthase subunit PhaE